jgi:hypothetical protein
MGNPGFGNRRFWDFLRTYILDKSAIESLNALIEQITQLARPDEIAVSLNV